MAPLPKKKTENNSNLPASSSEIETTTDPNILAKSALGTLLDEALNEKIVIKEKEIKIVRQEDLQSIVESVAKQYETTPQIALVGIFSTLQAGGNSKSKKSNVRITIQGLVFESKIINESINKRLKNMTPRQFSRFFANAIFTCSAHHNITGNAYIYLSRHFPSLLKGELHEKYWASDFQIDNPDCPGHIREALQQRYEKKFITKQK